MSEPHRPSDQEQRLDAEVPSPAVQSPSVQPTPQFSPDGRWWWNGQQWVPVPASSQTLAASSKSKVAAGLLAILLGDFGVHKFYLGQVGLGVVYLLFCWTLIPGIIGIIEGIIYLTMSDQAFEKRYGWR
jgi:TM2 domain-containing membrane protein YozV